MAPTALLALVLYPGVVKFNDIGDADDFDPKSDIFLLPGSGRIPIHSIMGQPPIHFTVRIATWISLIHQAQALSYFIYQKDTIDKPEWSKQLRAMLQQSNAVVPALHRSTSQFLGSSWATTIGTRNYYHIEHKTSGHLSTNNIQIDALLRLHKQSGKRYLFTINTYPTPPPQPSKSKDSATGLQSVLQTDSDLRTLHDRCGGRGGSWIFPRAQGP